MPKFIIVDAVIGAGKSTLLNLLQQKLESKGVCTICIPEPVDIWHETGALQAFYDDIKGQAYDFQTFAYATRCMRVCEYVEANPDADVFIMERSVISDRHLFVKMLQDAEQFTPLQNTMIKIWQDQWDRMLPFQQPTAFLYLAPSLSTTLQRIAQRNRTGEAVSEDYQRALLARHEEIFGTGIAPVSEDVAMTGIVPNKQTPVLRIYSDADYRDNLNHPVLCRMADFIVGLP